MAQLHLTSEFKNACVICRCQPVDETQEGRPPLPMIHALGVDVNWGQDLNICLVCASVMADLLQRPSAIEFKKVQKQLQTLIAEYDELQTKHEATTERVRKILEGKRAEKAQKGEGA